MSWPDDKEPRFVIFEISGYRINPAAKNVSRVKAMPFCAAVLDRAYAHRMVREFQTGTSKGRGGGRNAAEVRAQAEALAATLNAADAAGLMDEDVNPLEAAALSTRRDTAA